MDAGFLPRTARIKYPEGPGYSGQQSHSLLLADSASPPKSLHDARRWGAAVQYELLEFSTDAQLLERSHCAFSEPSTRPEASAPATSGLMPTNADAPLPSQMYKRHRTPGALCGQDPSVRSVAPAHRHLRRDSPAAASPTNAVALPAAAAAAVRPSPSSHPPEAVV